MSVYVPTASWFLYTPLKRAAVLAAEMFGEFKFVTSVRRVSFSMQSPSQQRIFLGIHVVKELQPHTLLADVKKEAYILAQLSGPFLPFLFGICTLTEPYRIVTQFYGIGDSMMSLTLQ